jgi:DNA-binding Lrp family transcriptional regulator
MSHRLSYEENTAYLVMVKGATFAGGDSNMPKSANTHNLAKKVLGLSADKVVFAHVLYGPDDLLVMIKGTTTAEAADLVRQIRELSRDTHDYVTDTHSHIVSDMFGRPPKRDEWNRRAPLGAWLFTKVGRPNPGEFIAEALFHSSAVKFVAPVFGQQDMFVFLETDSIEELEKVIDDEIRPLRNLSSTDTRITFQSKNA